MLLVRLVYFAIKMEHILPKIRQVNSTAFICLFFRQNWQITPCKGPFSTMFLSFSLQLTSFWIGSGFARALCDVMSLTQCLNPKLCFPHIHILQSAVPQSTQSVDLRIKRGSMPFLVVVEDSPNLTLT